MSCSFWRLTVRSDFSSGHALRNYNGKCENMHGHNFFVEITVQGDRLTDDTELLVDFTVIKKYLKNVLDALDHKDLNETPPFDTINPSSENLARYIFKQMVPCLTAYERVKMHSVTVSEKSAQSATYFEE